MRPVFLVDVSRLCTHDSWSGGCSAICFDQSGEIVASVGADGALIVCSVLDPKFAKKQNWKDTRDRAAKDYFSAKDCENQDSRDEILRSQNKPQELQSVIPSRNQVTINTLSYLCINCL